MEDITQGTKINREDRLFGPIVFKETKETTTVVVRKKDEKTISQYQLSQLTNSAFEAVRLGKKISERVMDSVSLVCNDFKGGYMSISFMVSKEMLEDSQTSQAAAILHELIENLQESENSFNPVHNETIPSLAEFLFTGDSRIPYFEILTSEMQGNIVKSRYERHAKGWRHATDFLARELGVDMNGFGSTDLMGELKRARQLTEEEKIGLLKKVIRENTIETHSS